LSKSRSGAPRRIAAGLLAGALSVVGIALAPPAGATDDATGDRIAGINRYATAAAIAGQDDFDGAVTAILATGETFPDALAASGLAGANAPAPIVLTASDSYSDEAQETLNNLTDVSDVIIVGGTAAISQDVEDAVAADGFAVSRVAGNDRYETAADIAGELASIGQVDGLDTALIASGAGFADALAGGPVAYDGGFPLLLTQPNELPAATATALADLGIEQVVILGGTAAVSDDVETELEGIVGADAIRVAGLNRFGTAAEVSQFAEEELGWAATEILLANGLNFPDALAGGPLGGERQAPILLLASVPDETLEEADRLSATVDKATCLGGVAACGEEDLETVVTEGLQSTDNDDDTDTPTNATATTRPELVSATIVETRTTSAATGTRPAGTYVKYCFDEPITGAAIVATSFFVYKADGTRYVGTGTETVTATGQTFTSGITSDDNKCAEIIFGGRGAGAADSGLLDQAAEAATLTLATVTRGAVTGAAGSATDTNIEGDAPLAPASSTPASAGITNSPDLVSVGNFRAGSTSGVTAVDFVFDENAFVAAGGVNPNATTGFHIVDALGNDYGCLASATTTDAGGLAAPGGSGTTTITVNCFEPTGFAPLQDFAAASFARGYVTTGSVGDAAGGTGNLNVLTAADVTGGTAGVTANPDLTSVLFVPDLVLGSDVVVFSFDEAVQGTDQNPPVTSGFRLYNTNGTETNVATVGACARSSSSNASVNCLFADNYLASQNFVGGSVTASAVRAADNGAINQPDEEGAAPSTGPTATSGRTDGPDLTGVAVGTSGLGGAQVTYTFDEDTADAVSLVDTPPGGSTTGTSTTAGGNSTGTAQNTLVLGLHAYTSDGIRLTCTSLANSLGNDATVQGARNEDTDNTIACTNFNVVGTGGTDVAGGAATATQIRSIVVGTVDYGAVDDESTTGADTSPEGAEIATGSTGTPAT
jgi:putative cell wall-binding protein